MPGLERNSRPSRRTLALILTPIVAVIVVGTIGNAIHPTLLKEHPLWLVAMEPRNRYLLLVANKDVDFVPYLLVATLRRLFSDPLFYLLGYLYGDAGVRWVEKRMGDGGALIQWIERAFAKAAPVMVFFFPGLAVCVLAGATGMSIPLFFAINIAGTVFMVSVMYFFADVVEGPLDAINGFYGDNNKWLTAVSIGLTILWLISQRMQGKAESVSAMERELEEAVEEVDEAEVDPDEHEESAS